MKRELRFTKRLIESLPVPAGKRAVYRDTLAHGLFLRVQPSGHKTFFWYRKVQNYPAKQTIGIFPELTIERARAKAAELNAGIANWKSRDYTGPSPLAPRVKVPTLGAVLEDYCEKHLRPNAKNPDAAIKYAKWQFDAYTASWRNRPLSSISRRDVKELHARIGEAHGAVTANRLIFSLRTLFNHAIHPDVALWDGANPCAKPKRFLFQEHSRERTIGRTEAPKFFTELANERNRDLRDFVLLLLFTAARRSTVLAMRWSEIDFDRRLWTITNSKGRSRQRSHTLPLIPEAVRILQARARKSEWVFPGQAGHLTTIQKPWARFVKRTGLANLHMHDLRRTHSTAAGNTSASTDVIQKILGHEEASAATRIYDRADRRDDVREAMSTAIADLLKQGETTPRKLLGPAK